MPNRHYPPAYLRYLKARLWNLGRPGFWGTAIVLSVVGLGTWEYWANPDVFTRKQNNQVTSQKPADSSLSAEDRAIAADIDNLPVLFNDFNQATLPVTANTPKEKTTEKNSNSLLDDVIKKQKAATDDAKSNSGLGVVNNAPPPNLTNPFVVQAENLLRGGTVNSKNQFLDANSLTATSEQTGALQNSSSFGIGFNNQTKNNQNPVSVSPLQAELNRTTNQNLSNSNGITPTQTNTLGQLPDRGATLTPPLNSLPNQTLVPINGAGYTQPGTNLQQNPYSNFNGSQPQSFPNSVPATPVTPPVTSVAPNNIAPYSTQIPVQAAPNNIAPYSTQIPSQAVPNNIAPYSTQIPNQNVVNPTTPGGYSNYGNSNLQQPSQLPQSNLSDRVKQYIGSGGRR
jgi:hypothetical protein